MAAGFTPKAIHPHHAIAFLTSDARMVDFRCLPPLCATANFMECARQPAGDVWQCLAPYLRQLVSDQYEGTAAPASTTHIVGGDDERDTVRLTLDPIPAASSAGAAFLACWHGPGAPAPRIRWCWFAGSDSIWWTGDKRNVFGVPGGEAGVTRSHFMRIIGAGDREHFAATMNRALEDGKPFNTVLRIAGGDLTIRQAGATLRTSDETPVVAGTIQTLTAGVTRQRPESCAYQTSLSPLPETEA